MKTEAVHFTNAPEIQHFATVKVNRNDNVYGAVWGEAVREYLKTAYHRENAQAEIVSDGIVYKVLDRGEVTAFYDVYGNTLFDVENQRLEKEYGYVVQEDRAAARPEAELENAAEEKRTESEKEEPDKGAGESQEEKPEEKSGSGITADVGISSDLTGIKHAAEEKLKKEWKAEKDKAFAELVIRYLLKRCGEDAGLARDVAQEHKTWKKCFDYIYSQARKQAKGNCAAVRDDVVYEWAEDYYHKDDKAEEEKKAKEATSRKKKEEDRKKKAAGKKRADMKNLKQAAKKEENAAEKPAEPPKPRKNPKEIDGQMDLFSMMGV